MTALVWASGSFLFFVPNSPADQIVLVLIYTGITSGAIASLSVRKEYYLVYLFLFLSPLAYLFYTSHNEISTTVIILLVIYGIFLTSLSLKYFQMINDGFKIRYENLDLIKDLQQANIDAQIASETKSEFLANMSHEIRTPMTGILGFVEQLAKKENDPERLRQFNIITKSGQTLLSIINDILDLSKIESGKMTLEPQPTDLHKLFDDTITLFDELIKSKNIDLHKEIDEKLPKCLIIDQLRFKQVILNLLSNAIKFTPSGGSISLQASYDHTTQILQCAVQDTGLGIGKEHLEKIFHAFAQEDTSTTRRYGGTGLGLTISSKLLHMMKGQIHVQSTLGEGSRFYLDVPVVSCKETDLFIDENLLDEKRVGNLVLKGHVLVVDDQEFNQMLLGTVLKQYGVTYDSANDGVDAVSLYRQNSYDAIFMDENMPNMNGIEATRQIRSIEEEHARTRTPIIAVTANALSYDKQRFLDAGMDEYISKPYTEEAVLNVLKHYLHNSKS
ncbi:conserved hypothetical protein [Sulfurovum sp. NBC37-1]|nr:conserved hypothetical protein [Sulfurovum sp. NBC37-1]